MDKLFVLMSERGSLGRYKNKVSKCRGFESLSRYHVSPTIAVGLRKTSPFSVASLPFTSTSKPFQAPFGGTVTL
ncbi:hypothetical protein ABIC03_004380 [Bradyrhizobium sp. RT6a]